MRRTHWLVSVLIMLLTACGDDPFLLRWQANPQEAVLLTLDRTELNTASGFNMLEGLAVVIEDPRTEGNWDFAVERQGGGMALLPPGVLGVISRSAIVPFPGVDFDEVRRAPTDTLVYVTDEAVQLQLGTTYVVRTYEQLGSFGRVCVFYGKVRPLEIDLQVGSLRFLHDTSPDCNNRNLVPPN